MDAVVEHTLYDWFRDIWLPAAGAIFIPVAIAFFTWWFGASRLEKQKEIQELRENLNFLVSISLGSINGLNFLAKRLQFQLEKEQNALDIIKGENPEKSFRFDDVCFGFVYDDVFKAVSLEKYAQCIDYISHFVSDIVLVKSLLNSLDAYIMERNHILLSLSNCEDPAQKSDRYISFLIGDYLAVKGLLNDVYRITLLLRKLIANVVKLNNDIKKLKLVSQCYNNEQMNFIKESEERFTPQANQEGTEK